VHVVAALDGEATFDAARRLAQDSAELLAGRHPDALTVAHRKDKRGGRVYLDVGRNAYGQTAVAPWSLRARPGAPVAAPVPWRDLEEGRVGPEHPSLRNVFRSLGQRSDPWRDLGVERGSVTGARERLGALCSG